MKCVLETSGSSWATSQEDCKSVKEAVDTFLGNAEEIGRFGDIRSAEGVILVDDCPAWALSIGPRGGVRKEAC